MSITTEQQQAIDYYADLAENGPMRPSDRQNLRHVLTVIREQSAQLEAAEETFADRMARKSLEAKAAKHAPKHSMHGEGEYFYACEACSGLPDGDRQ